MDDLLQDKLEQSKDTDAINETNGTLDISERERERERERDRQRQSGRERETDRQRQSGKEMDSGRREREKDRENREKHFLKVYDIMSYVKTLFFSITCNSRSPSSLYLPN